MRRLSKTHAVLSALLSAGAFSLVAAAPPALADGTAPGYPGSVLHVSIPGPTVSGKPVTIVATGTNQMTALGTPIDYGLVIFLVNPKALPGPCATSDATEETLAADNPNAARQLNFQDLSEGESGSFTINVPFTTDGSGPLLVCAYSEYVTDDAAWASTTATISGGRPALLSKPTLSHHGRHVSCSHGRWSSSPTAFSYRWKLNGRPSPGRQSSLRLPAHGRATVVCTVTARNASGATSAASRSLTLG